MSARLYIEGGESKEDQIRCREGFSKLLGKLGYSKDRRMPRLTACGGRNAGFDDFRTAHADAGKGDFVAMLIDSEDPLDDPEKAWQHLKKRDNWVKPKGARDEQVLFMTTSMETWIAADRESLKRLYGHKLQESALPPIKNLEKRDRTEVHEKLQHATRLCSNSYQKGKRSFLVVGELDPAALQSLPSFVRVKRILDKAL